MLFRASSNIPSIAYPLSHPLTHTPSFILSPPLFFSQVTGAAVGNINKEKVSEAYPLNPRTLEVLSKKEARYGTCSCHCLVMI